MNDNQQQEAPKIEFPLDYPIKVIGDNHEHFMVEVAAVVQRFDPKFQAKSITKVPSKKGTFVSLRFSIWATGEEQLSSMHKALLDVQAVKMVL